MSMKQENLIMAALTSHQHWFCIRGGGQLLWQQASSSSQKAAEDEKECTKENMQSAQQILPNDSGTQRQAIKHLRNPHRSI